MTWLQALVFVGGFAIIAGIWCWAECRDIRQHSEKTSDLYEK